MNNYFSCEKQSSRLRSESLASQPLAAQRGPMTAAQIIWHLCTVTVIVTALFSPSEGQTAKNASPDNESLVPPKAKTMQANAKLPDDGFVIGPEDLLAINVWKEPDISRSIPVRSDGKITLPLIGELQASGKTPGELEAQITGKLQSYISEPAVTVIVQEIRSQRFNILGQVAKPGSYLLSNSATVLDAIALAGGFRDFARKKSIYVLRQSGDGAQARLAFNYNQVIKGNSPQQNIKLKPRDTVVVP